MTAARTATRETSIEDTAILFRESGIDVTEWHEGAQAPAHIVCFQGDENEGFRAVEVAKSLNLTPALLRRTWWYGPGHEEGVLPWWELLFFYPRDSEVVFEPQVEASVAWVPSLPYSIDGVPVADDSLIVAASGMELKDPPKSASNGVMPV